MSSSAKNEVPLPKHINNYSRINLLEWVNKTLSSDYKKIEEMCSGVAYCQLLDIIFPGSVQLKKLKLAPNLEHEYMENLRIFQLGFKKLNIQKPIPIERLVKGRFQDNLEFLQWYRNFFDLNSNNNNTTSLNREDSQQLNKAVNSKPLVRTDTYDVLQNKDGKFKKLDVLLDSIKKLNEQTQVCKKDRDYYFSKLRMIETMLEEEKAKNTDNAFIPKVLDILYSEDEIQIVPQEPEEIIAPQEPEEIIAPQEPEEFINS